MRLPSSILCLALLSPMAIACGGSSATSKTPEATSRAPAEGAPDTEEAPSRTTEAAPAKPRCDDGSCFECGSGVCPSGFYCDDGVKSGAICSWVPSCAKTSSCDCLAHALGGAHCTTSGGGPHVTD